MELTLLGAARSVFAPASRLRVEAFFFKDCVCGFVPYMSTVLDAHANSCRVKCVLPHDQ